MIDQKMVNLCVEVYKKENLLMGDVMNLRVPTLRMRCNEFSKRSLWCKELIWLLAKVTKWLLCPRSDAEPFIWKCADPCPSAVHTNEDERHRGIQVSAT